MNGEMSLLIPAVRPWDSADAKAEEKFDIARDPQEHIDFCVNHCPYRECVNCLDGGKAEGAGRGSRYDAEALRQALTLRRTNREMCEQFGVSRRTVQHWKKRTVAGKGE